MTQGTRADPKGFLAPYLHANGSIEYHMFNTYDEALDACAEFEVAIARKVEAMRLNAEQRNTK